MIQYLKRKQIDDELYDLCIENSIQCRVYAFSWYLDIVSDDWDALVYANYEAVMPIPYVKALKYLRKKKILQPLFCQQLGIFSNEHQFELESAFLESFLKLKPIDYAFNSDNTIGEKFEIKANYELNLSGDYQNIKRRFSKGRKHGVSQSKKNNLELSENKDVTKMIELAKKYYTIRAFNDRFFNTLHLLVNQLIERGLGYLVDVKKSNEVVGAAFFVIYKQRIIYLFSFFSSRGKELQAPSFLINSIIEKYSGTSTLLDFEGSSIPSIAFFFKSFGGKEIQYFKYSSNALKIF